MNNITLIGRLTATPDIKATPSGKMVTTFTVAVQRKFKDANGEPITDYIDCVSWNSTAEFIAKWFDKGVRIGVLGELQTRIYEDANGKKVKVFEVLVKEVEFADGKTQANNTQVNTPTNNTTIGTDADGFLPLDNDENLPWGN